MRRGSKANNTRMCPPRGRSSFMLGWREPLMESTSGPSQRWAALLEQADGGSDALLLVVAELVPPRPERVGVLDFPHLVSISRSL